MGCSFASRDPTSRIVHPTIYGQHRTRCRDRFCGPRSRRGRPSASPHTARCRRRFPAGRSQQRGPTTGRRRRDCFAGHVPRTRSCPCRGPAPARWNGPTPGGSSIRRRAALPVRRDSAVAGRARADNASDWCKRRRRGRVLRSSAADPAAAGRQAPLRTCSRRSVFRGPHSTTVPVRRYGSRAASADVQRGGLGNLRSHSESVSGVPSPGSCLGFSSSACVQPKLGHLHPTTRRTSLGANHLTRAAPSTARWFPDRRQRVR